MDTLITKKLYANTHKNIPLSVPITPYLSIYFIQSKHPRPPKRNFIPYIVKNANSIYYIWYIFYPLPIHAPIREKSDCFLIVAVFAFPTTLDRYEFPKTFNLLMEQRVFIIKYPKNNRGSPSINYSFLLTFLHAIKFDHIILYNNVKYR